MQRERLAGLREAFAEVGVDWADVPVQERFEHTADAGADGAARLLEARPDLTALVCTSDILAVGALREARERGLRVPEDLSLAGFDGVPEGERIGLTTIRQPFRDKGREAGRLLLERGDRHSSEQVTLPTELIPGVTSRALRQSGEFFSGW